MIKYNDNKATELDTNKKIPETN